MAIKTSRDAASRGVWAAGIGAIGVLATVVVVGQAPPAPQTPTGQPGVSGGRGQEGGLPGRGRGRGGPSEAGRVYGPDGVWWGLDNTPMIPGLPWRIHDANRPQPPVVKPPARPGAPPGDAIILFDGVDLSKWGIRSQAGEYAPAEWPISNGVMTAGRGSLTTRDNYGDVQLHVEYKIPADVTGTSQSRGNSGLTFMGRYELQILDSYSNRTYADGMNASIYGEWPPMVNVSAPPGEWQTLDVVFEAPRFRGTALLAPATFTVFWNGTLVHNRQAVAGTTSLLTVHQYAPHEAELPLSIQGRAPLEFRNLWLRRIKGYDQPGD